MVDFKALNVLLIFLATIRHKTYMYLLKYDSFLNNLLVITIKSSVKIYRLFLKLCFIVV